MKKTTRAALSIAIALSIVVQPLAGFAVADELGTPTPDETVVSDRLDTPEVQDGEQEAPAPDVGTVDEEAAAEEVAAEEATTEEATAEEEAPVPADTEEQEPEKEPLDEAQDEQVEERGRASEEGTNSWRYSDGYYVAEDLVDSALGELTAMAEFKMWTKNANGEYVSSNGKVIPNAVKRGIDVSEWNTITSWAKVKADDVSFAIIRCGGRLSASRKNFTDSTWSQNVAECERLGIPYGVYFYSTAKTAAEAREEARYTINLLEGHNPSLPIYIDMEDEVQGAVSNATLADIATAWCTTIEEAGYTPGVYSYLSWWDNKLTSSCFNRWTRWVAQYYSSCEYEGPYAYWQCTGVGTINGINGYTDINFEIKNNENVYIAKKAATGMHSKPLSDGTYTIASQVNTNYVVDISSGSKAFAWNAQVYTSNGTAAQQYVFEARSDGLYTIKCVNSGMYLSLEPQGGKYGYNVVQATADGSLAQLWSIEGSGPYTIRSAYNTGYVLDLAGAVASNGRNVSVYASNNTNAQKWVVKSVSDGDSVSPESITDAKISGASNVPVGATTDYTVSGGTLKIKSGGSYATLSGKTLTGKGAGTVTLSVVNSSGKELTTKKVTIYSLENAYWTIATNLDKSYVLDLSGASLSNGGNIQLYKSNGTRAQKYCFVKDSSNGYVIKSALTGKALDVAGGSKANRANVQQYKPNGTGAQTWTIKVNADDTLVFINKGSGLALDVAGGYAANGRNVQQFTADGNNYQNWALTKTSCDMGAVWDGVYTITSAINKSYALDVSGASKNNSANVQLYTSNGTNAQRWKVQYVGGGMYKLTNVSSGKVLDIAGGKWANLANAQQYTWNGSNAQLWKPVLNSNGTYTFRRNGTDYVLDVSAGVASNGRNVQQYTKNGTAAQQWNLAQE